MALDRLCVVTGVSDSMHLGDTRYRCFHGTRQCVAAPSDRMHLLDRLYVGAEVNL